MSILLTLILILIFDKVFSTHSDPKDYSSHFIGKSILKFKNSPIDGYYPKFSSSCVFSNPVMPCVSMVIEIN